MTCPITWWAPDLAGVVLRTGPGCTCGSPATGGRGPLPVRGVGERGRPQRHDDGPGQRIWGFETNFGGLAELAIVKGPTS